jgi:hypothetical protein
MYELKPVLKKTRVPARIFFVETPNPCVNQASYSETKHLMKFLNVNTALSSGSVITVSLISGFRHGANDVFALLGFCAAHISI